MRCECGGRKQADRQGAVLFAALDDIAGLHEHLFRTAVFNRQLVDVIGLVNPHGVVRDRLLERQRHRSRTRSPMNEIDGEIFADERPRQTLRAVEIRPGSAGACCEDQEYRECSAAHAHSSMLGVTGDPGPATTPSDSRKRQPSDAIATFGCTSKIPPSGVMNSAVEAYCRQMVFEPRLAGWRPSAGQLAQLGRDC